MSRPGSRATDSPKCDLDSVTTTGTGPRRVVLPGARRPTLGPGCCLHCEVMAITSALAVPLEEIDRRRTFWVACAGLAIVTAALMVAIVVLTRGTLTYIIDDAYIHLSMARTFATTGTWGVVPGDWESADSSPGWILLLATLIKVVPAVTEWLPFIVNGLAALVVVWLVTSRQELVVLRRGSNSPVRYLAVMLLPSVLFLPELIVLGMEHTLQTALVLGLLIAFEWLIRDGVTARRALLYALFSLLGSAIRFETLFLSAGCALALVVPPLWSTFRLRRPDPGLWPRIGAAAAGTAAAVIPIVVMGVVDLAHGAFFFPNSIVEKTALLGHQSLLQTVVPTWSAISSNLGLDPFLIVLLGFGIVMAVRGPVLRPLWVAWVIGTLLHASYGQFGWDDRYQAYLVIVGVWLTLRTLPRIEWAPVRGRLVLALVLLLVVLPVGKFDYMVYAPEFRAYPDPGAAADGRLPGSLLRRTDGDGQRHRAGDLGAPGRPPRCLGAGQCLGAAPPVRRRVQLRTHDRACPGGSRGRGRPLLADLQLPGPPGVRQGGGLADRGGGQPGRHGRGLLCADGSRGPGDGG